MACIKLQCIWVMITKSQNLNIFFTSVLWVSHNIASVRSDEKPFEPPFANEPYACQYWRSLRGMFTLGMGVKRIRHKGALWVASMPRTTYLTLTCLWNYYSHFRSVIGCKVQNGTAALNWGSHEHIESLCFETKTHCDFETVKPHYIGGPGRTCILHIGLNRYATPLKTTKLFSVIKHAACGPSRKEV